MHPNEGEVLPRRNVTWLGLGLASAVVGLAACSSSSSSTGSTTATSTSASTTATTSATTGATTTGTGGTGGAATTSSTTGTGGMGGATTTATTGTTTTTGTGGAGGVGCTGGDVPLTVLNYIAWCTVTVNGGAPFSNTSQVVCVPPGTVMLDATPNNGFMFGDWYGVNGDMDAGVATEMATVTVGVGSSGACVSVCCPNTGTMDCPGSNQCP
jgi:hypothetical protein